MPVTLRQIVRWNEGELTSQAIVEAVASANPRRDVDVFFMDGLTQKLRCAFVSSIRDGKNEDIERVRQGELKLSPISRLWFRRYELTAGWLGVHAPHIKTY